MSVIADTMRNRVGALLDVRISSATTPSIDQVNEWMYEGAFNLCKILPTEMLGTMSLLKAYTSQAPPLALGGLELVRLITLEVGGVRARMYSYPDFLNVRDHMPQLHTGTSPAATLTPDAEGITNVTWLPVTPEDVNITYVTEPAPVSAWNKTAAPNLIPPDTWSELIVQYAVVQGKIQDEEEQAAGMLYQMWTASVQAFIGREVLGTDDPVAVEE